MKVVLHDRTHGLGQEMRDTAQRKLDRLVHHFGKVVDAELEFSEERKASDLATFVCRILVHLDGRRTPALYARERGQDAQTALDLALHKIDRQLIAFKDKVTHRREHLSAVRMPPEPEPAPGRPAVERMRVKLRPMSESEAMSELDADGQPLVVYLEEDSGEIQILVRNPDGSLAVIEPIVP